MFMKFAQNATLCKPVPLEGGWVFPVKFRPNCNFVLVARVEFVISQLGTADTEIHVLCAEHSELSKIPSFNRGIQVRM